MRVAVQEKAGNSIKHIAKAEPLRSVGCDREDCFVCTTGEGGKCQKNGSGYRIQCLTCQRDGVSTLYEGETARNAYDHSTVSFVLSLVLLQLIPPLSQSVVA